MKILHITDSHGTVKGPESRTDIYYITFLKKLYELGYVIKHQGIDMVIHTGDLFHTARVSDKFAGQVSEQMKAWGVPIYVVPGNHDIEGYTTDTIDQTKLGLLAKTGVIHLLDRDHPLTINAVQQPNGEVYTIAISGQEYYAHIDEGNAEDFEMQQDYADLNILAIHGYLTNVPQHPDIKCTMCNNVVTDADIILTGHYHRQFEFNGADVDIYNPGSMMRVEQTDYNRTHTPQYGILEIGLNSARQVEYDYKFYEFRIAQPSTTVFDYNAKYKAKTASITLDGFKNSLANTMNQIQPSSNVQNIIDGICQDPNNGIDAALHQAVTKVYQDTLQTIPDDFEVQPGFIEAQHSKKIAKVILKNFQSHEHTEVDFSNGLNIIVGESNNGKTSIMRGIMWVIDNQPLGTDFIMAGKNDCSVRVEYDDGTFIERGRTLKDTGYYKIQYIDENGNMQTADYRGFTNAVPVEVANVHQMPKVNITKDIETHLNVLSQLDGPFLLTESPLVKASAIGRITGTHVIDAAVKESNKTIQGNRKLIKSYTEDLTQKQNELNALPDVSMMETFATAYQNVVQHLKALGDFIYNVEQYQTQITSIEGLMVVEQDKLTEQKAYAQLVPVLNMAVAANTHVSRLENYFNDYQRIGRNILTETDTLNKTKVLGSLMPIVNNALDLYERTEELDARYKGIQEVTQAIYVREHEAAFNREYSQKLNDAITHCGLLIKYLTFTEPRIQDMQMLQEQQNTVVQEIAAHKKHMKTIKTSITKTQNEKNAFVVNFGICPCCGQKVEESHVAAITTFMEGQS